MIKVLLTCILLLILIEHSFASQIELTNEEKNYLKSKEISYCIDPNWEPFAYLDEENRHAGLTKDYLSIIERSLGIKAKFIQTKNWSETLEYLKNRKCDLTLEIAPTPSRREYLLFTDPYIKFPQVAATDTNAPFISNMIDLLDKKVGVIRNYAIGEILEKKYDGFKYIEVKSAEDGLEKVAHGEIDAFIDFLPSISRGINKVAIGNLKIGGKIDEKVWLGAGSRNDEPLLNTILQKTVQSIKPEEHKAILDKWMTIKFEHGTDYTLLWQVIALAIMILSLSFYWNRRLIIANSKTQTALIELSEAKKRMEELAITDQLTGLPNRHAIEPFIQQEMGRFRRGRTPTCLLIIDIDLFKKVNDQYGHSIGDQVLQHFGNTLMPIMRETDKLARWGGEEFIVLVADTPLYKATLVAEKIRKTIEESSHSELPDFTISIGVAELQPEQNFGSWYEAADTQLYQAKQNGRNRVYPLMESIEKQPITPVYIEWKSEYYSGNDDIDRQHTELFDEVNSVIDLCIGETPNEEVANVFKEILNKVIEHFHSEERMLHDVGFPDVLKHIAEHRQLALNGQDLIEDFVKGKVTKNRIIKYFSHEIIGNHLLASDVEYFTWIK